MTPPLMDSLRDEGSRVSRGGFTLDREKAREKLSKFQLADPHHYVLEFVQAAHILDASYIDIELDADEMRMTFDGIKLGRAELENLYRAGFARADTLKLRALRHLAIGVTAAWALDPSTFRIDVDDGDSRLRAVLARDGDDVITEEMSSGTSGTTIFLRERFRPEHLLEYFRYLRGMLAEEVALRSSCAHADIPILLNAQGISDGYRLRERAHGVVRIDTPHESGRLGITLDAGLVPANIKVLTHGVQVTQIHGSDEPFGYDAILDSDRLRKGLSQSEIVRDEAWETVRHDVITEAVYRSLARVVDGLEPIDAATRAQVLRRAATWLWKDAPENTSGSSATSRETAKRAFRGVPIWSYAHLSSSGEEETPTTDGFVSLDEIDSRYPGSQIPVSSVAMPKTGAADLPTTILVEPSYRHVFEAVFGDRLRDLTSSIARSRDRLERIDEITRRGRPSEPNPSYFQAHSTVEHGPFRSFVGIRAGNQQEAQSSRIEWTNEKLILHQRRADLGLTSLLIWFNGPLDFRMSEPHFESTDDYVDAAVAVIERLPSLAHRVLESIPPHAVVDWFRALTAFDKPRDIASQLEIPPDRVETMLERFRAEDAPGWHDFAERTAAQTDDEIAARIQSVGPLADIDAIEVGLERRVSLRDLLDLYREQGRLLRGHQMFPQLSGPNAVTGGASEVELVERFFGGLADPSAQGEHEVFTMLESTPDTSARSPETPDVPPPSPASAPRQPPASNAESRRIEIQASPAETASRQDADSPAFVPELQATLENAAFVALPGQVRLEERAGLPAGFLEDAACIVNTAHPIIAEALDDPNLSLWARTAVFVALAAGGTAAEREFSFEHLVDLVESS